MSPSHCLPDRSRRAPPIPTASVRGSGASEALAAHRADVAPVRGGMRRINHPMWEREWSCAQWSAYFFSSFPYSLLTETLEGVVRRLKETHLDNVAFTPTRLCGNPIGFLCSIPCHLQSLLPSATPLSRAILGLHLGFFQIMDCSHQAIAYFGLEISRQVWARGTCSPQLVGCQ